MISVTFDEIQRDPLKYLRQVEAGETLVIVRSDKPIAELRDFHRICDPGIIGETFSLVDPR